MRVANLLDGSDLTIPLHVINGKNDGPVLGLFASMHGDEYQGNRMLRPIINETDPSELSGTILAVPISNPLAFSHRTRKSPDPPEETVDFNDLGGAFPGRRLVPLFGSMETEDISLTMKMAAVITDEVLNKCKYTINLHGHHIFGSIKKMLYNRDDDKSTEMGKVFGLGIIHDPIRGPKTPPRTTGFGGYSVKLGIHGITPEIGGIGHSEAFEKESERLGTQGIRNIMVHLKMIDGEIKLPERQFYFRNAPHIRAKNGGYFISNMDAEDVGIGRPTKEVEKGDVLGIIYNPYTMKEMEQLKAPASGLLYMCRTSGPIEAQGYGIAIADFKGSKWIE